MIRNLPADVTCSGWQTLHMVLRTALTAGYLEDVYLIRLYPRHFYQITRELFSTDLSDEAYHSIHIPFLPANIFSKQSFVVSPKAEVRLWCYCCLRCAGENSWSVISVKYQQTAWWHFNLNFDKLSYFGQKCKHWQGQGDSQVLVICLLLPTWRFLPFTLSSSYHQAIRPHLPHNISKRFPMFFSPPTFWTGVEPCQ